MKVLKLGFAGGLPVVGGLSPDPPCLRLASAPRTVGMPRT